MPSAWGAIALDNNLIKRSKTAVVHSGAYQVGCTASATALRGYRALVLGEGSA